MANLKSSIKDIRRIKRRTQLRKPFERNAKSLVRKVLKSVKSGDSSSAVELLPLAYKAVDKAARKNIFHHNKASRLKSRMAKAVNSLV